MGSSSHRSKYGPVVVNAHDSRRSPSASSYDSRTSYSSTSTGGTSTFSSHGSSTSSGTSHYDEGHYRDSVSGGGVINTVPRRGYKGEVVVVVNHLARRETSPSEPRTGSTYGGPYDRTYERSYDQSYEQTYDNGSNGHY